MEAKRLQRLIKARQDWSEPLKSDDRKQGFKGWYASRSLPHFDAPGVRQFITYRLADAMPAARRTEWGAFVKLENDLEKQRKIEIYLDKGYGGCHLRHPRIADMVQKNLWHHDGAKYQLLAWVIMPNHVHVLIEIWNIPLSGVVKSWKSYTSKEAQRILRYRDASHPPRTFWENDYF